MKIKVLGNNHSVFDQYLFKIALKMKIKTLTLLMVILVACTSRELPDDYLLSVDFENFEPGKFTDKETKQAWKGAKIVSGNKDFIFYKTGLAHHPHYIVQENGNRFLRVVLPENKFGPVTGAQWRVPLVPSNEYMLTYRLKFDKNFDFVKGGKLPGLAGGTANSGGNVPTGYDGWSARMMFWEKGKISFYLYFPNQSSRYGERFYFKNTGGDTIRVTKGKWHTVKQFVKMNTPNKKDGVIKGWFDGKEVLVCDTIMFRKSSGLQIDQLLYSVFMGGADSTWAPQKDETIAFDDFLVTHPAKQK